MDEKIEVAVMGCPRCKAVYIKGCTTDAASYYSPLNSYSSFSVVQNFSKNPEINRLRHGNVATMSQHLGRRVSLRGIQAWFKISAAPGRF